jgi:hypothetical protein
MTCAGIDPEARLRTITLSRWKYGFEFVERATKSPALSVRWVRTQPRGRAAFSTDFEYPVISIRYRKAELPHPGIILAPGLLRSKEAYTESK